jgi:glycine cleavage system H lipoate-binding protein
MCLGPQQNHIHTVLDNTNISINCAIKTSPRNRNEKYISNGWIAFVKDVNIQPDSRVRFTVSDPPEFLNVVIIN